MPNAPGIVAVVGGGASGCLSAAHVARAAGRLGRVEVLLIEPDGLGRGVAYSTADPLIDRGRSRLTARRARW